MDEGSFFINLVVQAIGISFISDCLMMSDLFKGRLSFRRAQKIRQRFQIDTWIQYENTQFDMGTRNGYFCAYMTLVATFACQAPLIILPVILYCFISSFIEALNVVCVFKKETEDFGNIFKNTIKKVYTGILIGTGITTLQSMIEVNKFAMTLNVVLLAYHMGV